MASCLTHRCKITTREEAAAHSSPECVIYEDGVSPSEISEMNVEFTGWPAVEEINLDSQRESFMPGAPIKKVGSPDIKKVEEGKEIT